MAQASSSLEHFSLVRLNELLASSKQVSSNTAHGHDTVDYIFYSTVFSQLHGKWIEGNLKLISRLNLLTGKQVLDLGGLPSQAFPSDHLCLVAKFLLRGSRRRRWRRRIVILILTWLSATWNDLFRPLKHHNKFRFCPKRGASFQILVCGLLSARLPDYPSKSCLHRQIPRDLYFSKCLSSQKTWKFRIFLQYV